MKDVLTNNTHTLFDKSVFETFIKPGEITEVRVLDFKGRISNENVRGTLIGFFDNHNAFCDAVRGIDGQSHGGVYFTLQVIDPRLLARAFNRMKPAIAGTSDSNVLFYRWLPVDIDPERPANISSSDLELQEALRVRDAVANWLSENFQFSRPIKAMSGNGAHLLYRLPDLPVNQTNRTFIKNTLERIAHDFDSATVKIDTTVFNPARIWKLYGTTARKGDELPASEHRAARPHRMAYIEDLGVK